ncbi:PucR family transcriptional regulator [Erysipelothrix sp. HDW6C]|nr:PucR family transcriptional regulator [Erysipelothrix sp. HDW6C]
MDYSVSHVSVDTIFVEFINVVQENNKYIIGLLDTNDTIVACSSEGYIGKSRRTIPDTQQNCVFEITVHDQTFGSLWVNGEESLKMMSSLLLESLTTRIMYEMNEQRLQQKITKDDELIEILLKKDAFDRKRVIELSEELEIDQDKTRIAILVTHETGFDRNEVVRLKLKEDSKELIYSLIDAKTLLLFKDVPETLSNDKLKKHVLKYINGLQNWGLSDSSYSIGSMQNKLINYKESYQNCVWLYQHKRSQATITFFMDYLSEYYVKQVPIDSIRNYFDYYVDRAKGLDAEELIEITERLFQNSFNITQTADDLYIHKNTLIYKLKRYETIFDIDVRGSFEGKVFLMLIIEALKEHQQQKQVGEII